MIGYYIKTINKLIKDVKKLYKNPRNIDLLLELQIEINNKIGLVEKKVKSKRIEIGNLKNQLKKSKFPRHKTTLLKKLLNKMNTK